MTPVTNPLIAAHLAQMAGEFMNTDEEKHTAVYGFLAGLRAGSAGEPLRLNDIPTNLPSYANKGIRREFHYYLSAYVAGWLSTKRSVQLVIMVLLILVVGWYLYGGT